MRLPCAEMAQKQIAKYGPSRCCICGPRVTYKIWPQADFSAPNCQRVPKLALK